MNTLLDKELFPFSADLQASSMEQLNSHAKRYDFAKKEPIIHKGQPVDGVYLVASGHLRIYTMDTQGNEKPVYQLDQGDICIFSINCIMKKVVYPAWVTVGSDRAEVIAIPGPVFKQLYDDEPAVRNYVLDALSHRIFDLMSAIEENAIYDIEYRINSYLVRACSDTQTLYTSHQDIASTLGTAREVVSRHLKKLEHEGMVKLSRLRIEVIDPQQLAKRNIQSGL